MDVEDFSVKYFGSPQVVTSLRNELTSLHYQIGTLHDKRDALIEVLKGIDEALVILEVSQEP